MSDETSDAGGSGEGAPGAPEEEAFAAEKGVGEPEAFGGEQALAEAHEDRLRTRAAWSLVPAEVFALLFANCLFFAGVLAAWSRALPGEPSDPAKVINGLYSIKGSVIFALSLYGFWTSIFNIWHRQSKVWPFLVGALLALWVGVGKIASTIGSDAWTKAEDHLKEQKHTLLDEVTWRLGTIPPGAWLLTLGGIVVLVILIRGVMSGARSAKASGRRR